MIAGSALGDPALSGAIDVDDKLAQSPVSRFREQNFWVLTWAEAPHVQPTWLTRNSSPGSTSSWSTGRQIAYPDFFGEDAGPFDSHRAANPHFAFGFGEHFCAGARLARLEGRVVVSEVLARWPRYQIVGEPRRAPSTLLRQISSVDAVSEP